MMKNNKNDTLLHTLYIEKITEDLESISSILKTAAHKVKEQNISNYPIFPIAKEPIPIGFPILKSNEMGTYWNYNLSYLKEFIKRKIIHRQKVSYFVENYKDISQFCCLFLLDKKHISFLYIPYP